MTDPPSPFLPPPGAGPRALAPALARPARGADGPDPMEAMQPEAAG